MIFPGTYNPGDKTVRLAQWLRRVGLVEEGQVDPQDRAEVQSSRGFTVKLVLPRGGQALVSSVNGAS